MTKSIGPILQVVGTVASVATGNPAFAMAGNAIGGQISAKQSASAARQAASAQYESTQAALERQAEQDAKTRADLAPYREAGEATAPGLTKLVNDPNEQKNFIQSNPFYQSLAKDATDKLFANQAAKGKLGSGGTAEALQNSLLLLGNELLSSDVARKQTLVNTGQSAAAQTGVLGQAGTSNATDLITQGGNARAAGIIGANNARVQGAQDLVNLTSAVGGKPATETGAGTGTTTSAAASNPGISTLTDLTKLINL